MSCIQAPEENILDPVEDNDILFDVLQIPEEENVLVDSIEGVDDGGSLEEITELNDDEELNSTENELDEENTLDNISFQTLPAVRAKLKKPDDRNITVLERGDKSFFVCACGYSSGTKSGSARHKCRTAPNVSFACDECGQVCKNPGSLKRHQNSKHGQRFLSGQFYSVLMFFVFVKCFIGFSFHVHLNTVLYCIHQARLATAPRCVLRIFSF